MLLTVHYPTEAEPRDVRLQPSATFKVSFLAIFRYKVARPCYRRHYCRHASPVEPALLTQHCLCCFLFFLSFSQPEEHIWETRRIAS